MLNEGNSNIAKRRETGKVPSERENANEESAIHLAAKMGYIKILEMLIDCGVDVNAVANMPDHEKAYSGKNEG